jgi:hypothetical protein
MILFADFPRPWIHGDPGYCSVEFTRSVNLPDPFQARAVLRNEEEYADFPFDESFSSRIIGVITEEEMKKRTRLEQRRTLLDKFVGGCLWIIIVTLISPIIIGVIYAIIRGIS